MVVPLLVLAAAGGLCYRRVQQAKAQAQWQAAAQARRPKERGGAAGEDPQEDVEHSNPMAALGSAGSSAGSGGRRPEAWGEVHAGRTVRRAGSPSMPAV